MTTVYVPSRPVRRDWHTGELVPSMNLERAQEHGELFYVLDRDEIATGIEVCEALVELRMREVSRDDFVLFVGDPTAMAMVVRAHARLLPGARMNLLRWDRFHRDYMEVSLK